MRKWLTDRSALCILFFLISGLAVYQAFSFDPRARLMPLIIGIPTFLLSTAVLVVELVAQWKGKKQTGGAMDASRVKEAATEEEKRSRSRREIAAVLWLIGLIVIIWLAGLLWSIPIFLILFLRLQGHESWKLTLPISLGTWAVVYLLFVLVLKMELYTGLIQSMLGG